MFHLDPFWLLAAWRWHHLLSTTCSQCYSCLVTSHNMANICWQFWCSGHIVFSVINPHLEAVGKDSKKILPITFLSSTFTRMARQDFVWMLSVDFGWLLNSKTNCSKSIICNKTVIVFCARLGLINWFQYPCADLIPCINK